MYVYIHTYLYMTYMTRSGCCMNTGNRNVVLEIKLRILNVQLTMLS